MITASGLISVQHLFCVAEPGRAAQLQLAGSATGSATAASSATWGKERMVLMCLRPTKPAPSTAMRNGFMASPVGGGWPASVRLP